MQLKHSPGRLSPVPVLPAELHSRAARRHSALLAGAAPGPARFLRCLTRGGEPFWVEASEKRIDGRASTKR